MDRLILLDEEKLKRLLKSKTLCRVYLKLLEVRTIKISLSYNNNYKQFGFDTRSGFWKAIQKLVDIGLISILSSNRINTIIKVKDKYINGI